MSTLGLIISSTFLVSLIAFLVIITANVLRKYTHQLIAYASGIMLTAAVTHLIPESLEGLHSGLPVLTGFLIFLLLESVFHWHHCGDESCGQEKHLGWLVLLSDTFHNLTDGVLIAAAWLTSPLAGLSTTLAVAAHEIPQEVSDYAILLHSGFSRLGGAVANFISGLTAIIGGILAFFLLERVEMLIPWFLSIAAGGFLYIATVDLLPEVKHHVQTRKHVILQTIIFLAGVGTILLLHPLLEALIGV